MGRQNYSCQQIIRDRVVIKVLVRGIIISVISAYAPQSGLGDSMKDDF